MAFRPVRDRSNTDSQASGSWRTTCQIVSSKSNEGSGRSAMGYLPSLYCSNTKFQQNRPCTTGSLSDRQRVSGLIVLFKHACGPKGMRRHYDQGFELFYDSTYFELVLTRRPYLPGFPSPPQISKSKTSERTALPSFCFARRKYSTRLVTVAGRFPSLPTRSRKLR